MNQSKSTFGVTKDGETASLYRLENSGGAFLEATDFGCRIRSICIPDKDGILRDVCLGFSDLAGYEADGDSLGAAVGRHANRIGGACFTINNKVYELERNNGANHLHGGSKGFSSRIWETEQKENQIVFSRTFPDGEDGYPGTLQMRITYEWTEDNRLFITYQALSDKDTVINFTNHSYFNLEGNESCSVLEHLLTVDASEMTENDDTCLPTGVITPVDGTPFDFRCPKPIGRDIDAANEQLKNGGGYDHNFILEGNGFRRAAVLSAPKSGIRMTCFTDQPGIQVYTANFLSACTGKYGNTHCPRNSVCLETQHFPNATNLPQFPSVILKSGDLYSTTTWYAFDTV